MIFSHRTEPNRVETASLFITKSLRMIQELEMDFTRVESFFCSPIKAMSSFIIEHKTICNYAWLIMKKIRFVPVEVLCSHNYFEINCVEEDNCR